MTATSLCPKRSKIKIPKRLLSFQVSVTRHNSMTLMFRAGRSLTAAQAQRLFNPRLCRRSNWYSKLLSYIPHDLEEAVHSEF